MGQKDQIRLDSRGGDGGGLMRNGRRGGCTWRGGLSMGCTVYGGLSNDFGWFGGVFVGRRVALKYLYCVVVARRIGNGRNAVIAQWYVKKNWNM